MTYSATHGQLSAGPGRSGGKQIDEWTFSCGDPSLSSRTNTIRVVVHMVRTGDALSFKASSAGLDAPIAHSDIEVLRTLVESRLRYLEGGRSGITWEDWLEVKITDFDSERLDCGRAQLSIEVCPLKRGVHPVSGEVFTLIHGGTHAMPFPKSRRLEDAPVSPDRWHIDSAADVALIPATSENIAALAEIRRRLRMLRSRLADVLDQDSIANTLADLSSHLPMLK